MFGITYHQKQFLFKRKKKPLKTARLQKLNVMVFSFRHLFLRNIKTKNSFYKRALFIDLKTIKQQRSKN